ncbi:MAG: prepilin-type N-terminal cleavage/methylation domain-containing protein [Thermoanaerobaculia bacterium]
MGLVLDGRARPRRPRRSRGYSLVEVLLGLTILLVALVGLMPLFTKSIQQNLEGKQSTEATGHGRTQLEELLQLDFNNWLVNVEAGNERALHLYWTESDPAKRGDEYWTQSDPSPTVASWEMDSVVRQFGIQDVRDDDLDGILEVIVGLEDDDLDGMWDNPLPAGSLPPFVHLKSLDVSLQKKSSLTMGQPLLLDLQTIKAF